jgi:hypothetical protein
MWALGTANASAGLFAPRDWNCFVLERILMVMRQKSWFRTLATAPVAAAMAHHHGASHGSQPGHDHHDCTCISCCVGSVVTPPAPIAPTTVFVEAIRDGGIAHPAVASPARRAPEYSRPYTTGPPRA